MRILSLIKTGIAIIASNVRHGSIRKLAIPSQLERRENKMKLSKEIMLDILDGNIGKVIEDIITGHGRWSVTHKLIFEYDDNFSKKIYRAYYRMGNTEYQNESPWQYDDEVECTEMKLVEEVVQVYVEA
jgi:hypothetical protein